MGDQCERCAFVIHGLDHARAALSAAAERREPVALWSAPNAAAYMGAPVFRDIIHAATSEFPEVDAIGILDCGADAGYALAAFRHGVKFLRVELPPATSAKVSAIAEGAGATLVHKRPPAVDLADAADPFAVCRAGLSAGDPCASSGCQSGPPHVR